MNSAYIYICICSRGGASGKREYYSLSSSFRIRVILHDGRCTSATIYAQCTYYDRIYLLRRTILRERVIQHTYALLLLESEVASVFSVYHTAEVVLIECIRRLTEKVKKVCARRYRHISMKRRKLDLLGEEE